MAKKLITVLLTLTIIACSSISIYATDTTESRKTENTETTGQRIEPMTDEYDEAEAQKEAEQKKKAEEKKKKEEKYKNGLAAYIRKINPNVSKSKSKTLAGLFIKKGDKYDLDPKVLMAIAQGESTFYTNATNPYGYKGLMQTSDSLARSYGYSPSSLYKAEVSIEVGARYLKQMKKTYKTYSKALSAYAYGPGAVKAGNFSYSYANRALGYRDNIKKYLKRNNYM